MNKLLPMDEILHLIKTQEDDYKLSQLIRYRDDVYEYKFSVNSENLSQDFNSNFDKDSLKKQLNIMAEMEQAYSLEKIETITKNFNLDDLNEKICRT